MKYINTKQLSGFTPRLRLLVGWTLSGNVLSRYPSFEPCGPQHRAPHHRHGTWRKGRSKRRWSKERRSRRAQSLVHQKKYCQILVEFYGDFLCYFFTKVFREKRNFDNFINKNMHLNSIKICIIIIYISLIIFMYLQSIHTS